MRSYKDNDCENGNNNAQNNKNNYLIIFLGSYKIKRLFLEKKQHHQKGKDRPDDLDVRHPHG